MTTALCSCSLREAKAVSRGDKMTEIRRKEVRPLHETHGADVNSCPKNAFSCCGIEPDQALRDCEREDHRC